MRPLLLLLLLLLGSLSAAARARAEAGAARALDASAGAMTGGGAVSGAVSGSEVVADSDAGSGAVAGVAQGERVLLRMNRVTRGGCPYTASFLCTAKHFAMHMKYGLKWQKMEAANWNAISSHKNKFQLHNISAFFVNHMSAYEHATRKKFGYEKSESMTMEFSTSAVQAECLNIGQVHSHENSTIAMVPFYGGRPPNVTADLKVKSLGQGNSLVKGEIKAMQTLAVVCSLLRNFASVVVGVTREEDEKYIADMLVGIDAVTVRNRVKVLRLTTFKPANLPFALLEWGREYIRGVNDCERAQRVDMGNKIKKKRKKRSKDVINEKDEYVVKRLLQNESGDGYTETMSHVKSCNDLFPIFSGQIITHVYYTESDQILHFSDSVTRRAIISATNSSTFLIGRRMEKTVNAMYPPSDYMHVLSPTRALCGDSKQPYELDWPSSRFIHQINNSDTP